MGLAKYRPDIDGLRAIAVLSVVFFHLDLPYAAGGFVGVDVFFVISGYLITKLIRDEVESTGALRFGNFYLRRTRRLFPALLFTLATTFVAAALLFSPQDLERVGGAVVAAIVSVSNIYFWFESGYFETDAVLKPLLHTWSLGVEEQFYLVWPLFLSAIVGRRSRLVAPVVIGLAGILSLYANAAFLDAESPLLRAFVDTGGDWVGTSRSTIFFLAPFRVFEFAIGALLVWGEQHVPRVRALEESSLIAGLAAITLAVVRFDDETVFPAFNALVPCVGAALVIYGGRARLSGRLLDNRWMVWIGVISYSLYLVHWPLIVFWRYYVFRELLVGEKLLILGLSIAAAHAMVRFVERPFRVPAGLEGTRSTKRYLLGSAAFAILVAVPAAHSASNGGWDWRLPTEVRQSIEDMRAKRREYWGSWQVGIMDVRAFSDERLSVVVIGNSYAYDVANMLAEVDGIEVHFDGTTEHRCAAFTLPVDEGNQKFRKICAQAKAKFDRTYPKTDIIVLADHNATWEPTHEPWARELRANIQLLRNNGFDGPIVVYGERPRYRRHVYQLVLKFGRLNGVERFATGYLRASPAELHERTAFAERHFVDRGIHYFSPVAQLCDDEVCDVFTDEGKLIYFDNAHFSYDGLRHLAGGFAQYLREVAPATDRARPPVAAHPTERAATGAP